MRIQSSSSRCGFTLIELVVALVLAAIMMVGLMRVVLVASRETNQLKSERTDFIAARMLADRLRDDLINARGMSVGPSRIQINGFSIATQRLTTIRYETVAVGNANALVRRRGDRSELMWIGFGGFGFQSYEVIDDQTPIPDTAGNLPPAPNEFRLSARDQNGVLLFDEVIHHHAI